MYYYLHNNADLGWSDVVWVLVIGVFLAVFCWIFGVFGGPNDY